MFIQSVITEKNVFSLHHFSISWGDFLKFETTLINTVLEYEIVFEGQSKEEFFLMEFFHRHL